MALRIAADDIQRLIADVEARLGGRASLHKVDGIRVEFPDGWALVRPSVTEAVVSLRFEGLDERSLERIIAEIEAASGLLAGKLSHLRR